MMVPEISVHRCNDGLTLLSIANADAVRAWQADSDLPIPMATSDRTPRFHVGGFTVPPEATRVRLRLELDSITTSVTATWPERGATGKLHKPASVQGRKLK